MVKVQKIPIIKGYTSVLDGKDKREYDTYENDEGGGGGGASPPTGAGWLMEPEIKVYDGTSNSFILNNTPKFEINVYINKPNNSFFMLQDGDYTVAGTRITINNPALESGDRIKIIYAI